MNEEIVVSMGLDNTAFARGLRSAKEYASEFKHWMVDTFKDAFAPIAAAFAADRLFEAVKGVAEWGKQVKLAAEEAGTSTAFIQGLESASHKLGINFESAGNALSVLSRKMGEARMGGSEAQAAFEKWGITIEGLSTEQVFFKIADRMNAIEDPAKRSAMAFDLMGKSAKEMAVAMEIGGDALRGLIDSADKLTDNQLEKLHTLDAKLEEIGRKWHLFWGDIVTAGMDTPTPAGTNEAKLEARMRKIASAKGEDFDDLKHAHEIGPHFSPANSEFDDLKKEALEAMAAERMIAEHRSAHEAAKGQATAKQKKEDAEVEKNVDEFFRKQHDGHSKTLSLRERLKALTDDEYEQARRATDLSHGRVAAAKALVEFGATSLQIQQTMADIDKEDAKSAEDKDRFLRRQADVLDEIDKAHQGLDRASRSLAESKNSPNEYSVGELANSRFNFGGALGSDQSIAREIVQYQRYASFNKEHGDLDKLNFDTSHISDLRHQLSNLVSPQERDPYRGLAENVKDHTAALDKLVAKASREGLIVVPKAP